MPRRNIILVVIAIVVIGVIWAAIITLNVTQRVDTDGEQFAYIKSVGSQRYDVYVQDIEQDERFLVARRVYQPVKWHPNGEELYYIKGADSELIALNISTRQETAITSDVGNYGWSADGSVFYWNHFNNPRLINFGDPTTDNVQSLELDTIALDLSPNGRQLAVIIPEDDQEQGGDLALVDRESGELEFVLERDGVQARPIWSPDGSKIVFVDNVYDEQWGGITGQIIGVYDLEGEAVIEVKHEIFPDDPIVWSQGNDTLLIHTGFEAFGTIDFNGELVEGYVIGGEWPLWDAENRLIAYTEDDGQNASMCVEGLGANAIYSGCFPQHNNAATFAVGWRP